MVEEDFHLPSVRGSKDEVLTEILGWFPPCRVWVLSSRKTWWRTWGFLPQLRGFEVAMVCLNSSLERVCFHTSMHFYIAFDNS